MVILLHGDNSAGSRKRLQEIKAEYGQREIRGIDGKSLTEDALRQAVESPSLFADSLVVIIEQVFTSLGRKTSQIEKYTNIIIQASDSADIILWEPKECSKTVISLLPKAKVELFKLPTILFEFLDSLTPSNAKHILPLFEKVKETEAIELISYMIINRVRQLIQIKDAVMPEKMSPWQAGRLTNQAKSFTMDKLLSMHKQLLDIEFSLKSGASPISLTHKITNLIIDL